MTTNQLKDISVEQEKLNEKLSTAVMEGNIKELHQLLNEGANLHVLAARGNNLLSVAANRKKRAMFEELLTLEQDGKKLDINNQDIAGATLLLNAVKEEGMTYYVNRLLELGADPNIPSNDGMVPLIKAVAAGKKEEIEILLNCPMTNVNYAISGTGTTALLMAATAAGGADNLEISKLLLEKGADINAHDSSGKNVLLNSLFRIKQFMKKAEKEDLKELIKFFINQDIDLNYVAPSGMTAFWAAANELAHKEGDPQILQMMLDKGVNTNVWHSVGMEGISSALHAISHVMGTKVDLKFVQKVIALGANFNAPDEDGNTPAAFAYLKPQSREMALELNGDVNAIIYSKDAKKKVMKLPVVAAVAYDGDNGVEVMEEMINRGAIVTFQHDEAAKDKEPIIIAIGAGANKMFNLLLDSNQIDPNMKIKSSFTGQETSLLSYIVDERSNKQLTDALAQKSQILKIKKAREIDIQNGVQSIIDQEGFDKLDETLKAIDELEEILKKNRKAMYDKLLSKGADVNLKNEHEESAIFFANSPTTLQWLIDSNVDLFIKNKDGDDLLLDSIKNNKKKIIPFVLEQYRQARNPSVATMFYDLAFFDANSEYHRQNITNGILNTLSEEQRNILSPKIIPNTDPVEYEPEKDILVNHINYVDEDGNSPILVACANNNSYLVKLYKRLGGDINIANKHGETPLMHAIGASNLQLVEFLIEHGADLNAQTLGDDPKTVLDFAYDLENKEILEKVRISLGHDIVEGSISGIKKLKK